MSYILRTFFYSVGLVMLLCTWGMDPSTAQFKDFLILLHGPVFWNVVAIVGMLIVGLDITFSGKFASTVNIVIDAIGRYSKERLTKRNQ